jgi:hypothetical protein
MISENVPKYIFVNENILNQFFGISAKNASKGTFIGDL